MCEALRRGTVDVMSDHPETRDRARWLSGIVEMYTEVGPHSESFTSPSLSSARLQAAVGRCISPPRSISAQLNLCRRCVPLCAAVCSCVTAVCSCSRSHTSPPLPRLTFS